MTIRIRVTRPPCSADAGGMRRHWMSWPRPRTPAGMHGSIVNRRPAVRHEKRAFEPELIAKALQAIANETSYEGLAKALLKAALSCSGAARGAVLLSERSELVAKTDASFPRERSKFVASEPPASDFRLPPDLSERVLRRQEIVVRHTSRKGEVLIDPAECPSGLNITVFCLPLIHQQQTIGALYLESERRHTFTPRCMWVMSMLASRAAVSFEFMQLLEAFRETNIWMVKGQQIGRIGSFRWNTRTQLTRASRECYQIFDISLDENPVLFEAFRNRVHPDDLLALDQALAEAVSVKSPFSHEYRVVHRDGRTLHVCAVAQFNLGLTGDVELEGIITDVTERRASEQALADARAQLARAARLASLGELAGSIVHEVNQPLTGIIMSAEACLRWLAREPPEPGEARKSAQRVIEEGRRASKVVRGISSLARGGRLQLADVQINDAIEEVLPLLNRELERVRVMLRTDFDTSIPMVKADRLQLQQVILNLVRNAIDAMAGVSGRARVLIISSRIIFGYVSVSIVDTGVGISSTDQERLFDALYTTKGEGLGLGLSISRKIVDAHGGQLWMKKNAAHGVTFSFALPVHPSANS
jgi:signal transduction histidine kinase